MKLLDVFLTLFFLQAIARAEVEQIQVRATLEAVHGNNITVTINKRSVVLPKNVADPDSLKVGKGKTIELTLRADDISRIFSQVKNRAPASAKKRK